MDIGLHVQGEVEKEEKERLDREGDENAIVLSKLTADLNEAIKLTDSLKGLEDNNDWLTLQRILIQPALVKFKKEISKLNETLKDHPENVSQLIYNNAFLEVLTVMSDFEAIRKNNQKQQKVLQVKIKELQKKTKNA